MSGPWEQLADGVYRLVHPLARVNIGLVLGGSAGLVVDTGGTGRAGTEILTAVRELTDLPCVVANTHGHFDHAFGNSAFGPVPRWAHRDCARRLEEYGEVQRAALLSRLGGGQAELRRDLVDTRIVVPDHLVTDGSTVDLGGRMVELTYLGRGHTDHDLVFTVPDAGLIFGGDLVEEGPSPGFTDSFPLDWVDTMAAFVTLAADRPVLPGHGGLLAPAELAVQAERMATVVALARDAYGAGEPEAALAGRLPLPQWSAPDAAARAYRQLAGLPDYDPPDDLLARIRSGD